MIANQYWKIGTLICPMSFISAGQGGGGPGVAHEVDFAEDIAISLWSLRRYFKDIAKHNFKTLATFNTRYDFVPDILQ